MDTTKFTVKKETIEVYKIRHEDGGYWADISIDTGDNCGTLNIRSDYGDWSYYWGSCGSSFRTFLLGLNIGYVAGKFKEDNHFDLKSTIENMKRQVLESRRWEDIESDKARDLYNEIKEFEQYKNKDYFTTLFHQSILYDHFEYCDLSFEISPQFIQFWEKIWPVFIGEIKKEIDTTESLS